MNNTNEFTIGINENALDDIMLKLNNDIDSISTLLHDIEMKFYDIDQYFKGDVAESVQNKFKSYSSQFEGIKENLNTYVNDLMNVKSMLGKVDVSNINYFEEKADDLTKEKAVVDSDNALNDNEIIAPEGY